VSKADDLRVQGHAMCPTCDQKLCKLNPHRMDKAKIRVFDAMARIDGWVFMAHDKSVKKGDQEFPTLLDSRVHAQRLYAFGLVDYMGKRTGTYKVNEKGIAFLCGKTTVPEVIWLRRSPEGGFRVEEVSSTLISVNEARGVVLDREYWDAYWTRQK
jgi:hypothetical protein